jgi:hypothetical protein
MNNTIKHLPNGDFEVLEAEITGTLKEWAIHTWPGTNKKVAIGKVYNDTKGRFPDGYVIRTSYIVAEQDGYIRTRNSVYKLEGPKVDIDTYI